MKTLILVTLPLALLSQTDRTCYYSGPDMSGYDLSSWYNTEGQHQSSYCETMCRQDAACNSWMYRNSGGTCYQSVDTTLKLRNADGTRYSDHHPHLFIAATCNPTPKPTPAPTPSPTPAPTPTPTPYPTPSPTNPPTPAPTYAPTPAPTPAPTSPPTSSPTVSPTVSPSISPSFSPTTTPTRSPTKSPTTITSDPTTGPTKYPTTYHPTIRVRRFTANPTNSGENAVASSTQQIQSSMVAKVHLNSKSGANYVVIGSVIGSVVSCAVMVVLIVLVVNLRNKKNAYYKQYKDLIEMKQGLENTAFYMAPSSVTEGHEKIAYVDVELPAVISDAVSTTDGYDASEYDSDCTGMTNGETGGYQEKNVVGHEIHNNVDIINSINSTVL